VTYLFYKSLNYSFAEVFIPAHIKYRPFLPNRNRCSALLFWSSSIRSGTGGYDDTDGEANAWGENQNSAPTPAIALGDGRHYLHRLPEWWLWWRQSVRGA
jgi:hypothetical protein